MTMPPVPSVPDVDPPDLPDPAEAPTPDGYHAAWWPAMVDVPGLPRMQRARAYATPDGLYLWTRRPREGEVPDVFVPILWDLTGPLPSGTQARIQGVYLATEFGLVHVTPTGGCGCSSALRQWAPSWAHRALTGWPGSAFETRTVEQQQADRELEPDLGDPNSNSSSAEVPE